MFLSFQSMSGPSKPGNYNKPNTLLITSLQKLSYHNKVILKVQQIKSSVVLVTFLVIWALLVS